MHEWTLSPGSRGLLLRVCEWPGSSSTAPITIVLHGFLEQGAAWDAVARDLGRRVLAPDQRGHGRSGHVGTGGFYHFWDYVADLDALIEHVGGPIDLVGHSMGGTVASLYAGTRPEQVRRLVLVEGLGPPDTTDRAVERAVQFLDGQKRAPTHRTLADVDAGVARVQAYNPGIPDAVARTMVTRTTKPVPQGVTWTWDPLHRARSPTPFSAELFGRFLDRITARTLSITGGRSGFRLPDEAERAARLRDATHLTLPEAGHLVHHDAPVVLANAIRAHLDAP